MPSIFERWKQGLVDTWLASLQLLSFVVTVLLMVCAVLLYRHFSSSALAPAWTYLASVKLAVPPVAILTVSYFYAFLTGAPVTEAPRTLWNWLRNNALQSQPLMTIYCAVCLCASAMILAYIHATSPPVYERLVAQLLGGSNDDHAVISDQIKALKDTNPSLMAHIENVKQVFEERRKWNHDNKPPNATLPRIFIRTLDANIEDDPEWKDHPLRWFASAEAHSMLAQALGVGSSTTATMHVLALSRETALTLYDRVASDFSNPLVTKLMLTSARQNQGNVLYYSGKFKEALALYTTLNEALRSTAVEANIVASLVQLRRFDEAIQTGTTAVGRSRSTGRALTEVRDYISLLTNIGFAQMIVQKNSDALEGMQEVHDLVPDSMAKQNLALANIADGKLEAALDALADDDTAPQLSSETQLDVVTKKGGGSCAYLIRGVAITAAKGDAVDAAANFAAYARQGVARGDLAHATNHWTDVAKASLLKDSRPCGNLAYLPVIRKYLEL